MTGKSGFKKRIFRGQKLRNFPFYFCFSQVLDIMNSMKTFFLDPECFWEKKKDRNCNKFLDSSWQVGQKTLLKALKASLMTFANSNMKSSSKMSHFSDLIQIRISYQKISVLSFEAYVVMVATSFLHSHPKFSDIVSVPKVWICDLWLLLQQLLF